MQMAEQEREEYWNGNEGFEDIEVTLNQLIQNHSAEIRISSKKNTHFRLIN